MPCEPKHKRLQPLQYNDIPGRMRMQACDRILLYAHGLELDAPSSLKLAHDSLDRAGSEADMHSIITSMHTLLQEQMGNALIHDTSGNPLRSAPPLCRSSMVSSRSGGCHPLLGWLGQTIRKTFCMIIPGKPAWKHHKI